MSIGKTPRKLGWQRESERRQKSKNKEKINKGSVMMRAVGTIFHQQKAAVNEQRMKGLIPLP